MNQRRMPMMPGMPPGMGMAPVVTPLPAGGVSIGSAPPQQSPQQEARANFLRSKNPFPLSKDSMKALRALSECPITREADAINEATKMVVSMDNNEELLEILGKGISTILNADNYCEKSLKTRTVVLFEEDDQLTKIQDEIESLDTELQALQQTLAEKATRMQELLHTRWRTAVKNYALSDDSRAYRIDEENGRIEQVDLRCQECKGGTKIRKIRQELNERIFAHGAGRHPGLDHSSEEGVSEEADDHGGGEET